MEEEPDDRAPDRALLGDLVFHFLESSDAPDSSPADVLEDLCSEHPDLAAPLRAAVERLSMAGFGLPQDQVPAGERVVGPYRLVGRLGAGGMGVVHRAERVDGAGDPVALKLLHPRQVEEPEMRERFAREVEAIERLDHPGIVRVVDHGEVLEGDVSLPYLAMTLQSGVSLDAFLLAAAGLEVSSPDGEELTDLLASMAAGDGPVSGTLRGPWWSVVARIGAEVASALAHAHGRGVVHRDIKPSNLIVTPEGRVMLLDFGLASVQDSGRLTRTGAQLGSLPYMSPEQVSGERVGPPADVYGLGLVLYELLTLEPAFAPSTWNDLVADIRRGRSLRPSRVVQHLPAQIAEDVDGIVERATQPEAAHRFPSADALAADLEALLEGRRTQARPMGPLTRTARAIERHPRRAMAAAGGAVLVLAAYLAYGSYEGRLAAAERNSISDEIHGLETQIDLLRTGTLDVADDRLGDDPSFAPRALPRLMKDRESLEAARARLRELAASGEDVGELLMDAEVAIGDMIIEVANAHSTLGNSEAAIELYRERVEHTERLLEERTAALGEAPKFFLSEHGRSLGMLAREMHISSPADIGLEPARLAVDAFEQVIERIDVTPRNYSQLVAALLLYAEAQSRSGAPEEAAATLDRAEDVSRAAFGEVPEGLRQRAQRAEIELRRVRHGMVLGGRPMRIEALRRAAALFDDGPGSVERDAVVSMVRLDVDQDLVLELRRDRQFEAALRCAEEYVERCERLVDARGVGEDSEDPFATELREARILVTLLEADLGGDDERDAKVATLWTAHERARKALEAAPDDPVARGRYIQRAGVYANQASFDTEAPAWEVQRAIQAVDAALETEGIDDPMYFRQRRLCYYGRGLALVRAGRIDDAFGAVRTLELLGRESSPGLVDAVSLRMAADLCSELLVLDPTDRPLARRTLDLLEGAVDAGFDDLKDLSNTEALDPLRGDPRFEALLERLRER